MVASHAADTGLETSWARADSTAIRHDLGEISLEAAIYWSGMSIRLSESGDQVAALEARQHAVGIYWHLYAKEPQRFEGNLARELLELSKNFGENGQIDEALEASRESGRVYRHILERQSRDGPSRSIAPPRINSASRLINVGQLVLSFSQLVFQDIISSLSKRN